MAACRTCATAPASGPRPFPNPDAVQEFSVVSSTYGARYVSASGGAVNIVIKFGTNQLHGTVFEFVRNGDFNERNFFAATQDQLRVNGLPKAVPEPLTPNPSQCEGRRASAYQR